MFHCEIFRGQTTEGVLLDKSDTDLAEPPPKDARAGADLEYIFVESLKSLPEWADLSGLAKLLHQIMKPYEDTESDILRGLEYALSSESGRGGFLIIARKSDVIVGAVVILETGMGGYVPENLLLFVGVHPDNRGAGIGGELVRRAVARCKGDVKLHVEPDNPAKRIYERCGFANKYLEMRVSNKPS